MQISSNDLSDTDRSNAKPLLKISNSQPSVTLERKDDFSTPVTHRPGDVVLRDGSTVRVRGMRADDAVPLLALFQSLSEESLWMRFFGPTKASALAAEALREATLEMLVGVVHDPQFGPVVACGAGGVLVELLRDVSVRLTPLSQEDVSEMVRSLKTFPLLNGFRGAPVCDVAALEDGLLRVSALVEDIPQIAELDCNPYVVHEHGAVILDARVRVAAADPRPLLGTRC